MFQRPLPEPSMFGSVPGQRVGTLGRPDHGRFGTEATEVFGDADASRRGAQADPEPDDLAVVVRRAAEGDQDAWNRLVDRFTPLLWSITRVLRLRDADAADVVQTVWLRLVQNLGRVQDPQRLAGWLATTTRRESFKVLRRNAPERPLDQSVVDLVPAQTAPPDQDLLTTERDAALWRAFSRLPTASQELLRVLLVEPAASYEAVAAGLGRPVGSIGPSRQRALRRLLELVRTEGLESATT